MVAGRLRGRGRGRCERWDDCGDLDDVIGEGARDGEWARGRWIKRCCRHSVVYGRIFKASVAAETSFSPEDLVGEPEEAVGVGDALIRLIFKELAGFVGPVTSLAVLRGTIVGNMGTTGAGFANVVIVHPLQSDVVVRHVESGDPAANTHLMKNCSSEKVHLC